MDSIVRGAIGYLFLLTIFRVAGRRTLAQTTTFDLVLVLVIGGAARTALLGNDSSMTNAFLVITTLVALDVGFSLMKRRWPRFDRWFEGMPLVVVEDGKPLSDRMSWARIDEEDILEAARIRQGLGRLDQIQYAILERSGGISIIPKAGARDRSAGSEARDLQPPPGRPLPA
jgi:uncharacterized membrane protein YcaP (DUF421 family)